MQPQTFPSVAKDRKITLPNEGSSESVEIGIKSKLGKVKDAHSDVELCPTPKMNPKDNSVLMQKVRSVFQE